MECKKVVNKFELIIIRTTNNSQLFKKPKKTPINDKDSDQEQAHTDCKLPYPVCTIKSNLSGNILPTY